MSVSEKLATIAEKMPEVYAAGQKSEYDRFWDLYQNNGGRVNYNYGFVHGGWTNKTFKPKYDIEPTVAVSMFYLTGISGDLVELLNEIGVKLDFSKCTNNTGIFNCASKITRLGEISTVSANTNTNLFIQMIRLETIDKFIVHTNGAQTYSNTFSDCTALKNITVEGVIGKAINFQSCPLTPASMKSVITHLANYAGTANEGKCTVTFTEACWTALEADSTAPGGGTWKSYVNDVLGWLT